MKRLSLRSFRNVFRRVSEPLYNDTAEQQTAPSTSLEEALSKLTVLQFSAMPMGGEHGMMGHILPLLFQAVAHTEGFGEPSSSFPLTNQHCSDALHRPNVKSSITGASASPAVDRLREAVWYPNTRLDEVPLAVAASWSHSSPSVEGMAAWRQWTKSKTRLNSNSGAPTAAVAPLQQSNPIQVPEGSPLVIATPNASSVSAEPILVCPPSLTATTPTTVLSQEEVQRPNHSVAAATAPQALPTVQPAPPIPDPIVVTPLSLQPSQEGDIVVQRNPLHITNEAQLRAMLLDSQTLLPPHVLIKLFEMSLQCGISWTKKEVRHISTRLTHHATALPYSMQVLLRAEFGVRAPLRKFLPTAAESTHYNIHSTHFSDHHSIGTSGSKTALTSSIAPLPRGSRLQNRTKK